jgi:hypothetical protein
VQYVVATGFSLVLFVLMGNLLVNLYVRAAVRDALDEGVRAAVPARAPTASCAATAREVIDSVVRGTQLRVHDLTCERRGERIVATARISLDSWLLLPDSRLTLRADATKER